MPQDRNDPRYVDDPGYVWHCGRWMTLEGAANHKAAIQRYRRSVKGRETIRAANRRLNPQRLIVGRTYLGMVGFTEAEREAMVRGSSERP